MEKKKKDGLQNRREFFKKATKSVLPILGAIVLANLPGVLKAADAEPMGCSADGCSHSCSTSCARECRGTCYSMCRDSCHNSSK